MRLFDTSHVAAIEELSDNKGDNKSSEKTEDREKIDDNRCRIVTVVHQDVRVWPISVTNIDIFVPALPGIKAQPKDPGDLTEEN